MKVFAFIVLGLTLLELSSARRYERCELARELASYGFPQSQLPDWICLVESESNFNTQAINHNNKNGSKDWGLFQINDRYWCKGSYPNGYNICGIDCRTLLDASLGYQTNCVQKIYRAHGFEAWNGWKSKCRGKNLPSLNYCFIFQ